MGAAVFAFLAQYVLMPSDPSRFEAAFYPSAGIVAGFVAGYAVIFAFNATFAAVRQRDEAWAALDAVPPPESVRAALELVFAEDRTELSKKLNAYSFHIRNVGPEAAENVIPYIVQLSPSDDCNCKFPIRLWVRPGELEINSDDDAEVFLLKLLIEQEDEGAQQAYALFNAYRETGGDPYARPCRLLLREADYEIVVRATARNAREAIQKLIVRRGAGERDVSFHPV